MFAIIDNVLPKPIFNRIEGLVCRNTQFKFGAVRTTLPTDKHVSFATTPGSEIEKQLFALPLVMALSKFNLDIQDLFRIRFGILHRDIKQIVNTPHVDYPQEKHMVGLYYLNDTDGTTKIWKQTHSDWGNQHKMLSFDDVDVMEEIPPKANRMVIFNGKHYHSSTLPTKTQLRFTVNYNFTYSKLEG